MLQGYLRADGRKGIRNVARRRLPRRVRASRRARDRRAVPRAGRAPDRLSRLLSERLRARDDGEAVHASQRRRRAARLARLRGLRQAAARADRSRPPAARCATLGIQDTGGTRKTIAAGRDWVEQTLPDARARRRRCRWRIDELIVGTICGGSDATSGLTANPAMGVAFDLLVADGAKTIFEETGELIGMEHLMAARAATPALGDELKRTVAKAARLLRDAGLRELRARQRRRRAHDDRGEVARRLRQVRPVARSTASSSPASRRRARGSTCSTSCPTARCASAFPTSTTTPRSPS